VDHFAGARFLNRRQQFLLDRSLMGHLVLGHMDDYQTDLKLGKVLLELNAAVDRQENVKLLLRDR
jgi:hypothetical protein